MKNVCITPLTAVFEIPSHKLGDTLVLVSFCHDDGVQVLK